MNESAKVYELPTSNAALRLAEERMVKRAAEARRERETRHPRYLALLDKVIAKARAK